MQTSPEAILELKNISKSFAHLEVLKNINFKIHRQEVVVIIGPSGSGKSTLLRSANFLEIPTSGNVLFNNQVINDKSQKDLNQLRSQVGMVFQNFNLFPHFTVLQNLMEAPCQVKKVSPTKAKEIANDLLQKVGLSDKAHCYPRQLSGGQQQRVAIARALAMNPEILLFDEPTSALDPELVGEVLKTIKKLALEGMTMIIVTHEMGFARDVADRIVFIDRGEILEEASPDLFFTSPKHARAKEFLTNLLSK